MCPTNKVDKGTVKTNKGNNEETSSISSSFFLGIWMFITHGKQALFENGCCVVRRKTGLIMSTNQRTAVGPAPTLREALALVDTPSKQ